MQLSEYDTLYYLAIRYVSSLWVLSTVSEKECEEEYSGVRAGNVVFGCMTQSRRSLTYTNS